MDNQTLQRDQDVIAYAQFAGLRSDVPPERFGMGDLVSADNVDIDGSGYLARRAGFTQQVAGGCHSLWADPQQQWCLFVQNGALKRLNTDYTSTALVTLHDGLAPISYTRVSDRIYWSNGTDTGVIDCQSAQARSWGLPVPPLPSVTATVGYMPAGTYQYTMTWVRSDGQESGAPLAGSIALPAGAGLTFTLPTPSDPGITGAILYLTMPNGDVLMMAELVSPAMGRVTYQNDTLELSTPLVTQFLRPAPAGQLVAFYRGRLFIALGDVLLSSTPFGYELFDLREYVQLDGRITLLAPLVDRELYDSGKNSGLFIGTDRSCGVLVGAQPSEFQYVPKLDYGAIPGALSYADASLFGDHSAGARPLPVWLTTQGICAGQPDMNIRNLTRSRYTFSASGRGAAVFMSGPKRFVATANQ